MKLTRFSRWCAAVIALISMLSMQLAVAAYVCPQMAVEPSTGQGQVMAAAQHHEMSCCEKPDPVQPALCHAHGQVGKQSLDKPEPPPVQPFTAVGLVISLPFADMVAADAGAPVYIASLARTTAPPLAIRNCCLRI
jgi:hypothetical protein